METKILILLIVGILGIVLISGCVQEKTKVLDGVEFEIQNAEYEDGKIILTLSTNASVENVRIDIVDEADNLLCTRYKDLIAGTTQIELTDCKAEKKVTVIVSQPGGGIITKDFTLDMPIPKVEISGAEYLLGAQLILKLKANIDIENARIEVSDESGTVLCTQYADLSEGLNEIKPKGCGAGEKITVSVTPPEGVMTAADLVLELPLLELKEGFKYVYATSRCPDCQKRDSAIYVTKETSGYWEGISSIKINNRAYLMRWKVDKVDLDILLTMPLAENALFEEPDYVSIDQLEHMGEEGSSIFPFWMIIMKDMEGLDIDELITKYETTLYTKSGDKAKFSTSDPELYNNYLAYTLDIEVRQEGKTETIIFIISSTKPYLVMNINTGGEGQTTFKKAEQKEFSLDDFKGYSIEEWTPPPPPDGIKK